MNSQIKTILLLSLLSGVILALGAMLGGRGGLVIAFVFALAMNAGSYWFSDKIVLSMYKAQELAPEDAPALHRMVEELSAAAQIPKPRVYVVPEEAANAFATGRNPENAAVAVTAGITRLLSPDELRGVLAHEIGHIANRDILIQTVAATLATVIMFVSNIVRWGAIFGMGRDGEEGSNPFALLAMAIVAPFAAMLIQMAISRTREYKADQSGARYSGTPGDLASALEKISAASTRRPLKQGNLATENMFIVNPFSGRSLAGLFSTHPPVEERVRRLRAMPPGR